MKISYNFYLIKNKKLKEKPIVLYLRAKKQTIVFSTGISIEEKFWNFSEKKLKKNYPFTFDLNQRLNDFLIKIKNISDELISIQNDIDLLTLKNEINKRLNPAPENNKIIDFWHELDRFIEYTKYNASITTAKGYSRIIKWLKLFNKKTTFNIIDKNYLDEFKTFLIKKKLSNNYIKKLVKIFKTFLNQCYDAGTLKNDNYKKSNNLTSVDVTHVALTQSELQKIENVELPENLMRARDIFLFMLYCGQRYSDAMRFNLSDVTNDIWELKQLKTKKIVRIPLTNKALKIISKYNYSLPKLSNVKLNYYIKDVCKIAGIDELTKVSKFEGKKEIELLQPKYELVTTHTARRSFVSLSLYNQIPFNVVMQITGHTTTEMLNEYFKNDLTETAKLFKNVFDN